MNLSRLRKLCAALDDATRNHRNVKIDNVENRPFFRLCLVAAYAKNIEFSLYIQHLRKRDASFFLLGTLRGICEDYISLRFLSSLGSLIRDEATMCLFGRALGESVRAQGEYFERHRPYQMVVTQPKPGIDKFLSNIDAELKKIGKALNWKPHTAFPTTKYMAKTIDELDLYEYLYHGTSNLVHFNPRVLTEMGWGPLPGDMIFSPKNFQSYYFEFCVFYSALLLSKFSLNLSTELGLPQEVRELAAQVESLLNEPGRWPELVTFEAMNVKPTAMDHMHHIVRVMMAEQDAQKNSSPSDGAL